MKFNCTEHILYSEFMTGSDNRFWYTYLQTSVNTSNYYRQKSRVDFYQDRLDNTNNWQTYPGATLTASGIGRDAHLISLSEQLNNQYKKITNHNDVIVLAGHPGIKNIPATGWPFDDNCNMWFHVNMFSTADAFLFAAWWFSSRNTYPFDNEMDTQDWQGLFDRIESYYLDKYSIIRDVKSRDIYFTDFVSLALQDEWDKIDEHVLKLTHSKQLDKSATSMLQSHWNEVRLVNFKNWTSSIDYDEIRQYIDNSKYMQIVKELRK